MEDAHTHTRAHSVSLLTGKANCSSVHLPFPKSCFVHYQKTVKLVYVNVSGKGGGGSANFESVYSVYRCQPAAAIIAEAETRHPVRLRARPKLTHARLCRRSASGYCRSPLPSHSSPQIFQKLPVCFTSANCIVSPHEQCGHNSIKSNVQK